MYIVYINANMFHICRHDVFIYLVKCKYFYCKNVTLITSDEIDRDIFGKYMNLIGFGFALDTLLFLDQLQPIYFRGKFTFNFLKLI